MLIQNSNQTNAPTNHGNSCGHRRLKILSCIRSKAKRDCLAVLLSEHGIDFVQRCESCINFLQNYAKCIHNTKVVGVLLGVRSH